MSIVVNAPGLQERRAAAFAAHSSRLVVADILVAPNGRDLRRAISASDVLYVVDAGRGGTKALLRSLGRIPVVVELGDPQALLYRAQGRGAASRFAGATIDCLAPLAARAVVVRGRELAGAIGMHGPWCFIPDGVDTRRFDRQDAAGLRQHLGLPYDHMVVGLAGSLTWSSERRWCYGLEVVEALARLGDVPVSALLVGDGTGMDRLVARAEVLGVSDRLVFAGRRPHGEMPLYLSAIDVCVSSQSDDPIGRGRTTAKLPEYLAVDRHVLATKVGEAARILPDHMLIDHRGPLDVRYAERLAGALRTLVPERHRLRGSAGTRAIALERFDYATLTAQWEAFLTDFRTW